MNQVIAWIVSLMTSVAPLGRPQYIPEAKESVEEMAARYDSIAQDAIEVVFDPNEKPVFSGPYARIKTLEVMLATSFFESGWRKDVDFGEGKHSKGDGGGSWCLNQINLGPLSKTSKYEGTPKRIIVTSGGGILFTDHRSEEGWSGVDLVTDRKKCFYAALAVMRSSFAACRSYPLNERLRQYASGKCENGAIESRRRMGLAMRWMTVKVPTFKDADVMAWRTPEEAPPQRDFVSPLLVSEFKPQIQSGELHGPFIR